MVCAILQYACLQDDVLIDTGADGERRYGGSRDSFRDRTRYFFPLLVVHSPLLGFVAGIVFIQGHGIEEHFSIAALIVLFAKGRLYGGILTTNGC